jgi:hypothetical protein
VFRNVCHSVLYQQLRKIKSGINIGSVVGECQLIFFIEKRYRKLCMHCQLKKNDLDVNRI